MSYFKRLTDNDDPTANSKIFISIAALVVYIGVVVAAVWWGKDVPDNILWSLLILIGTGAGISELSSLIKLLKKPK
jgi:hypothetical protein